MSQQQQPPATATPGWADSTLIDSMRCSDADTGHHSQWWKGMNNGMSKCWLMQDGHDTVHTRYGATDGAPLSFVYECNESSLPQVRWPQTLPACQCHPTTLGCI